MSAANDTDDWCIECSDDEKYGVKANGDWYIPRDEIIRMYETLDQEKTLKLQWECPGMRSLSPAGDEHYKEGDDESMESKPEEKSDFDFNDEMTAPNLSRLRVSDAAPIGSAKKKTTSLDGILSNIRRHRQIEEMEKQATTNPNS